MYLALLVIGVSELIPGIHLILRPKRSKALLLSLSAKVHVLRLTGILMLIISLFALMSLDLPITLPNGIGIAIVSITFIKSIVLDVVANRIIDFFREFYRKLNTSGLHKLGSLGIIVALICFWCVYKTHVQ